MSNLRTPSASGFYGSRSASRSAANRLLQQCVQEALAKKRASTLNVTPARSQTSMPRRTSNFYGPGVFLEEVNRTEDENNSESEDGGPDFDFDFGDSRQKDGSSLPHDHERCHSPEIPLHNPVSDFEVRRVDSYSGQNSHTTGHQNEVMPMLQQQQMILQKVLESQKALEERQNKIEDKLANLQTLMDKPSVSSPTSSSDGKRKRLVTRALSNKVYSIHKEAEKQFDTTKLFSSECNKQVKALLVKEVKSQPDCKFEEATIILAVKRCYENLRRTYIEQQSEKKDFVQEQAKRRKYRSRRERKFQRRSSVVTKGEREKYWKHLSLVYVTEESDDPDNPNGLIEHKLPWRSQKLDQFMDVLDRRLSKKPQPAGLVAKKVRKIGTPSDCTPPNDAPAWALAKDNGNKENNETRGTGSNETRDGDSVQDFD